MGNLHKIYKELIGEIKTRPKHPKYPTGIQQLDDIIWGLHKKQLLTIGARPGQGKTSLATDMAVNIARDGSNVLFISLEMSKGQILEKIISSVCGINNYKLRVANINKQEWEQIDAMEPIFEKLNFTIVDNMGAKFQETEGLIKQVKPDFVFFDFIQMLYVPPGMQSKVLAIEDFVRNLKILAKTYNCGVILLSQVNRTAQDRRDKRPTLYDLKGSGSLEEASDTVLLCYWEWKETGKKKGIETEYEIEVAKQRFGFTGKIKIDFEAKYSRFNSK